MMSSFLRRSLQHQVQKINFVIINNEKAPQFAELFFLQRFKSNLTLAMDKKVCIAQIFI